MSRNLQSAYLQYFLLLLRGPESYKSRKLSIDRHQLGRSASFVAWKENISNKIKRDLIYKYNFSAYQV